MSIFFPDLLLLVDYTNITSILIIILCSIGMTLFIYLFRLTGDLSHRTVDFRPHQRNMVKVSNPFVMELDQSTKELGDDLKLNLSTLCPCHVVIVWGPKIQALHDLILMQGRTVREKMLTDLEQNTNLEPLHSDILRFDVEGKHSIALHSPECVSSGTLGDMPRSRYPLAVFIFTPERDGDGHSGDTSHGIEEKDNDIIGLFVIVHLKDETVKKDSHIIAKYVKTAGIPLYSLQALFASTTDQSQQGSTPIQRRNIEPEQCNQSHEPSTSTNLRHRNTSKLSTATNYEGSEQTRCAQGATSNEDFVCQRNEGVSSGNTLEAHEKSDRDCNPNNYSSNRDNGHFIMNSQSGVLQGVSNFPDGDSNFSKETNRQHENNDCHRDKENENMLQSNLSSDVFANSTKIPDCVVCQTCPAKCALLPCRHNCVCVRCLQLLDKCPMCRGVLESYFIVGQEQGDEDEDEEDGVLDEEEEENERVIRQGIAAQVENMFERVNQMVGFA